jgi:prophage tail gpP-like protein
MPEDVVLSIAGSRYRAWNEIEIQRSIDGYSTVSFAAPFDPSRAEFRETFRPFSFLPITVEINDEALFTGTLLSPDPSTDPNAQSAKISAYALPAVLADAHMPASAFPLEMNGLTLRQIAEQITAPFGLTVEDEGEAGAAFERVALKPDEYPQQFLAELARQRGKVIADTGAGGVLLRRSAPAGTPVARLREGLPPVLSVSPSFSPQDYYSEITALASAKAGRAGARHTVQNPHLSGVVRPHTFIADDTEKGDLPGAAAAKLGRMFGNMVSYTVELPTWRDPAGRLYEPNTTITLLADGSMIYRETELLIRNVSLWQDQNAEKATLTVVLPGAFSGEVPEVLPWQE